MGSKTRVVYFSTSASLTHHGERRVPCDLLEGALTAGGYGSRRRISTRSRRGTTRGDRSRSSPSSISWCALFYRPSLLLSGRGAPDAKQEDFRTSWGIERLPPGWYRAEARRRWSSFSDGDVYDDDDRDSSNSYS
jgi:hypothetical protein